jgi:hypothetical protein
VLAKHVERPMRVIHEVRVVWHDLCHRSRKCVERAPPASYGTAVSPPPVPQAGSRTVHEVSLVRRART